MLKHLRYFLESPFPDVLQTLLKDQIIANARISSRDESEDSELLTSEAPESVNIAGKL